MCSGPLAISKLIKAYVWISLIHHDTCTCCCHLYQRIGVEECEDLPHRSLTDGPTTFPAWRARKLNESELSNFACGFLYLCSVDASTSCYLDNFIAWPLCFRNRDWIRARTDPKISQLRKKLRGSSSDQKKLHLGTSEQFRTVGQSCVYCCPSL